MKTGCFYIKDGICVWKQETCEAMGQECDHETPKIPVEKIREENEYGSD